MSERLAAQAALSHLVLALILLIATLHGIVLASDAVPREQILIVHVTTLDVLNSSQLSPSSGRHEAERTELLKRISRDAGKWDNKHPRWSILEALHGFDHYRDLAGAEVDRFEDLYKHVPRKHKQILESTINYDRNFPKARSLLDINAAVCKSIVQHALTFYNLSRAELNSFINKAEAGKPKQGLRTSVSQALKHMVRDWSDEGHTERHAAFPYILHALNEFLPPTGAGFGKTYNVLVPGAGLGRLAHEIAQLGPHFTVTSNEHSAYMNIAYRYIASLSPPHPQLTIHPYVETWSHARTRHELFRPVHIPDSSAITTPSNTLLIEGDFTRIFHLSPGTYDVITTLFFIDTARNLVSYLEKIYDLLKPGGLWINVGPLLYGSAPWVQLTLEEVLAVAELVGFVFDVSSVQEREVPYNFNASALYKNEYVAQCWVARKRKAEDEKNGWWGQL